MQELVTLFKNYMYDFDFADYILFVGGVSNTVRIDDEINSFGIENVNFDALQKMIEGLKEEAKEKEYIDDKDITDTNISDFLKKVLEEYAKLTNLPEGESCRILTLHFVGCYISYEAVKCS